MENHGKSWKIGKKTHGYHSTNGWSTSFSFGSLWADSKSRASVRLSQELNILVLLIHFGCLELEQLGPPKSCPQPFNHVQQFLPRLNPNSCRIRCVSTCENPYPAGLPHSPPVLSIILISQQVAALVPGLCSSHQQPRFVSHMWIHWSVYLVGRTLKIDSSIVWGGYRCCIYTCVCACALQ